MLLLPRETAKKEQVWKNRKYLGWFWTLRKRRQKKKKEEEEEREKEKESTKTRKIARRS